MSRTTAAYGTWPSPLSPEKVAGAAVRFGAVEGRGAWLFWAETRPEEAGRGVVMRVPIGEEGPSGAPQALVPAPCSVRSKVHEYGGGAFLAGDEVLWFVNDDDQDIYSVNLPAGDGRDGNGGSEGGAPVRVTNVPDMRFADMAWDGARGRLLAVCEHHAPGVEHPRNRLAAIALEGAGRGAVSALVTGHDFYACPRLSPDGRRLAFLAWDLPDMPWESAALHVATLDAGGGIADMRRIAGGGGKDGAAFQPEWAPDGSLLFVSDRTGWGGLYRWDGKGVREVFARPGMELFRPLWSFDARSWALCPETGRIGCAALEAGEPRFLMLDATTGSVIETPDLPFAAIEAPVAVAGRFAALVSDHDAPPGIALLTGKGAPQRIAPPPALPLPPDAISRARMLAFESEDAVRVHGLYYPPASASHDGPAGAAPPAILKVHGGPTGMAGRGYDPRIQFWTSRGFAVFDIDYRGSAGYGRAFREALDGGWGERDVADLLAGARFLAREGLADPARLVLTGGSAGGYTVLMALARAKPGTFAAASVAYPVTDLGQLLAITHKFEAGYLFALTGTTPDNWRETFATRSPLRLADLIATPLIIFQGLDDKVVPPAQSEAMAERLREQGVRVELVTFPGEGHGFRRAETIAAMLAREEAFLRESLALATPG